MKILEFLACLSWLLLPAFANFGPFTQLPTLSLDHPERIMEERGQLDCLGHNFQDLDILRRFESALTLYPEVRVGCETISVKPFRPSSQLHPEDSWDWTDRAYNKNGQENYKVPPRNARELEDKAFKYFVIDMSGVETQVGHGSAVTVETYDLSQVHVSEFDSTCGPVLSDLSTRLETFTFDQLCFPTVCYRPGEKQPQECINVYEWLTPEDGGSFLAECATFPNSECNFMMGHTADKRRKSNGKPGSVLASNITTYCSLETSNGPLLGPLRTPNYSGLPDLLRSSSSPRSQVHSDIFNEPDDQDVGKRNLKTPAILSHHLRTDQYKDHTYVTSCLVTLPLEAPFNTSFAVDFFVAHSDSITSRPRPIRPGQQMALTAEVAERVQGHGFKTHFSTYQVKFEDLCFPSECHQEPPPADDVKCQIREDNTRIKSGQVPPGAVLLYVDPARDINKLMWPTEGYYNKFSL